MTVVSTSIKTIKINWTKSEQEGDKYNIRFKKVTPVVCSEKDWFNFTRDNEYEVTIMGLEEGSGYIIIVAKINGAGEVSDPVFETTNEIG